MAFGLLLLLCYLGSTIAQTADVPAEGDLRLASGSADNEGRVEIFMNGTFYTACRDDWDQHDTNVVCRQLNLPFSRALFRVYPAGDGPVFLNNVECTGSEARLLDCDANEVDDSQYCERIGVGCYDESTTNGNLRLIGGSSGYEGRVEIFISGSWGTVCDDDWDDNNAAVVCKQLGFNNTVAVFAGTTFGPGTGTIWLDDVDCTGMENSLILCGHEPVGSHNCAHREDAGVFCLPINQDIANGSVRLVGGSSEFEGQVQVFWAGIWGTVCDDSWDNADASVVCRQLNFTTSRPQATVRARFGTGSGRILLDEVRCNGQEQRLIDCPHNGIMNHDCVRQEDAGVICRPYDPLVCSGGTVRLTGGTTASEGRVEICLDNSWRTACSDEWTAREARVICRQLMLPHTNATVLRSAFFGEGTSILIVGNVNCHGREASITACGYSDLSTCGHEKDVGVRCLEAGELPTGVGEIRLVGGTTELEGRVEVFSDYGTWGTVCDDHWDESDATVVCQQLGYPTEGATALGLALFGGGALSQFIMLDDVDCDGDEPRLVDCNHRGLNIHDCLHSEDACVRCSPPPAPGPPVNIQVSPSTFDCSQVIISWDFPADYEYPHLISYYTIFVTTYEREGTTLTETSSTNRIVIINLPCGLSFVCFITTSAIQVGSGVTSNATIFETLTAEAVLDSLRSTEVSTTSSEMTERVGSSSAMIPWISALSALVAVVVIASVCIIIVVCCRRKKKSSSHDVDDSRVHVTTNKFTTNRREFSLASTGEQVAAENPIQLRQDIGP